MRMRKMMKMMYNYYYYYYWEGIFDCFDYHDDDGGDDEDAEDCVVNYNLVKMMRLNYDLTLIYMMMNLLLTKLDLLVVWEVLVHLNGSYTYSDSVTNLNWSNHRQHLVMRR